MLRQPCLCSNRHFSSLFESFELGIEAEESPRGRLDGVQSVMSSDRTVDISYMESVTYPLDSPFSNYLVQNAFR